MKSLRQVIKDVAVLGAATAWTLGITIAPGFWGVVGATFFPPYAWALLTQVLYKHWGLL